MIATRYTLSQPGTEYRQRLAFALQGAYTSHQYTSTALADAIREFVRSARHRGLTLEWVLVAIQDVIDAGILPALRDGDRAAFSAPILQLAQEAFTHCREVPGVRAPAFSIGEPSSASPADPLSGRSPQHPVRADASPVDR